MSEAMPEQPEKADKPVDRVEPVKPAELSSIKPPRPQKWRRRFRVFLLTVVILFFAFRLVLEFMLPTQKRPLLSTAPSFSRMDGAFSSDVNEVSCLVARLKVAICPRVATMRPPARRNPRAVTGAAVG